MARCSREVGIIKSAIMGTAMLGALTASAQANDWTLGGTAAFTTDYIFRGLTNSNNSPAVQASFDLGYGIFYAGIWGTNTDFGDGIEIDYYVGITPKWGSITFDIAPLYYTFPGQNTDLDFFELKTGATWAGGNWSLAAINYWSPDFAGAFGQSDAIEGAVGYSFGGKLFNFFSPSISGTIGYQSYEELAADYTYWNAGLTLGFLERWSADVRYWDTSYDDTDCVGNIGIRSGCDARVVGTVKASF